jgi:chromosome segregation ATPase
MSIELQVISIILFGIVTIIYGIQAFTGRTVSANKQADAVTALALMNNQERQDAQGERLNIQEQVSLLRENFAGAKAINGELQARLDRLQIKADSSEAQVHLLENQMANLTVARTSDQATIAEMKSEIKDLNKTIGSRDETIAKQEKTIAELSSTIAELKTQLADLSAQVASLLTTEKKETP